MPYMPQLNQVIHEAPNASNIEFNLIHVTAEPKSIPSEQTSKPVDNFVEEQALPKADLLEETKKECAIDTLSKVDTSIGKPSTGIADMDVGSNLTLETSQPESLPSAHVDQSVPSESTKLPSEGGDFQEKSDPQNLSSLADVNKVNSNQPTGSLVKIVDSGTQTGADT